jgi:DNA-binding response OmpR family regulator
VTEGRPIRILVGDSDIAFVRLLRETLTSQFRCEVDGTPNAEYAFELALKKPYRLFIFDLALPPIDGALLYSLISKVYNHVSPPLKVPPLILVSGRGGGDARGRELTKEPGVRAFFPKPFTMERLVEKVRQVLPDLAAAA